MTAPSRTPTDRRRCARIRARLARAASSEGGFALVEVTVAATEADGQTDGTGRVLIKQVTATVSYTVNHVTHTVSEAATIGYQTATLSANSLTLASPTVPGSTNTAGTATAPVIGSPTYS